MLGMINIVPNQNNLNSDIPEKHFSTRCLLVKKKDNALNEVKINNLHIHESSVCI